MRHKPGNYSDVYGGTIFFINIQEQTYIANDNLQYSVNVLELLVRARYGQY